MRSRSTIRLPATSTCRGASKSVQQAHRPGRAGQVGRAPDPEPYDGPRAWNLPKPAVRDVPSDPSRRITYCHEAWEGRQYPVPKTLPFRGGGLQQTIRSNPSPVIKPVLLRQPLVDRKRSRVRCGTKDVPETPGKGSYVPEPVTPGTPSASLSVMRVLGRSPSGRFRGCARLTIGDTSAPPTRPRWGYPASRPRSWSSRADAKHFRLFRCVWWRELSPT